MEYHSCPPHILSGVEQERSTLEPDVQIYPPNNLLFRALDLCPLSQVKVVILGQDPYHGGQANGLAFSVDPSFPIPPSLRNIFKELANDTQTPMRTNPDLSDWGAKGVLLLNSTLTVRHGNPNSHINLGWEAYTDSLIQQISDTKEMVVFMLWGSFARKKKKLIDSTKHHILEATHPSPLGANRGGWFGCKHFSQANSILNETLFP